MKLYSHSGMCSLSPHIILRESGLDFTLITVDLQTQKTEQHEDYLKINSKGQVPALQLDDGTVLTEGVAIVQYLADLKPDRQLLAPAGSLTRYQTLAWLNFIATELHKRFDPLFRPGVPEEYRIMVREQLQQKLGWVNGELRGKHWLMGLRFSVADAYLYTIMRWVKHIRLDISGLAELEEWYQRVEERPAVRAALETEGLKTQGLNT